MGGFHNGGGGRQMGDTRDCIMHPKVADYTAPGIRRSTRGTHGFHGIFDDDAGVLTAPRRATHLFRP